MTDQPAAPFSPFTPSPPPTPMFEGEVAGKKPRKKRAKRAETKPARKLRKDKHNLAEQVKTLGSDSLLPPTQTARKRAARKPGRVMIPIGILPALGGLQEAETSMLMSIIGNLQDVPKKSRAKIVAALGKVFA